MTRSVGYIQNWFSVQRTYCFVTLPQLIRHSAQRSAFPWQISQSEGFCERDGESWRWAAYRAEQSPQAFEHIPSPLPPPRPARREEQRGLAD